MFLSPTDIANPLNQLAQMAEFTFPTGQLTSCVNRKPLVSLYKTCKKHSLDPDMSGCGRSIPELVLL